MMNALANVREGMNVLDKSGQKVGTVDWVKMSDEDPALASPGVITQDSPPGVNRTLVDDIMRAFNDDSVPEELHEQMMREGFVRVDGEGLFAADRYVLPTQIDGVSGESLKLAVGKDELIKRNM